MIRPMTQADIPTLVTIETECFLTPWTKENFEGELKNDRARFFVLTEGEEIVGYYGMWLVIDEFDVANVAVSSAHRRKGYGRQLVEHMLATAAAESVTAITLEVRVSNAPAIALYERYGFRGDVLLLPAVSMPVHF